MVSEHFHPMGGASKEAAAAKKIEEQVGVMQIQLQSHGVDIQEMKSRMEVILQGQDEMKQTMNVLLERSEANPAAGRGTSGTPNSGIVTPPNDPMNKNKGTEGSGTGGSGHGGSSSGGFNSGNPPIIFGTVPPMESGRGKYKYRHRKIDMPGFDGSDPDGWILQAERYFTIYQLNNGEKLEAAILALSGDALSWYRWSHNQQPVVTWEQMKALFLKKFRPVLGGNMYEQWNSLTQTTTTAEYVRRYIELAAPLEGVSNDVAIASFLKGLKQEIRDELHM